MPDYTKIRTCDIVKFRNLSKASIFYKGLDIFNISGFFR